MRRKVRGLRTIEQAVLREEAKNVVSEAKDAVSCGLDPADIEQPPPRASPPLPASHGETPAAATLTEQAPTRDEEVAGAGASRAAEQVATQLSPAGQLVLDYCAAVRGILNDDQGGPLHPPGLRMANALTEVHKSLERNLEAKKGGPQRNDCSV
jgi:hypothetical protein